MRESLWDPQLTPVLGGYYGRDMLPVSRRSLANVQSHVKNGSPSDADEFPLRVRGKLEVQSAHDPTN